MPRIRIVSLGEVVPQLQNRALDDFAKLINPENPKDALGVLKDILGRMKTFEDLSSFKTGSMSEEEFTNIMIKRINESTNVKLTTEQFDTAWNAMNPTVAEFSPLLGEVIRENTGEQQIVFVSYTNPKDMRHLRQMLDSAGIKYTLDENNELNSIDGVPLHLSYATKRPKGDLILHVIQKMTPAPSSAMFTSAPLDIKYVRSINGDKDPIMAFLHDQSDQAAVDAAEKKGVDVLIWNKQAGQSFRDTIQAGQSYSIDPAKLS